MRLRHALMVVALLTAPVLAQDEDEELPHGLIGRYTRQGAVTERVDPDIQFTWGEGTPAPNIGKPFRVLWTGQLFTKGATNYRFHAFVSGSVKVEVGDKTVLDASQTESAAWKDGQPVPLDFGEHALRVTYHADEASPAVVRLFWSSDEFPLEPVPPQVLFHTKADKPGERTEHAPQLHERFRCARCHTPEASGEAAPSLANAAGNVSRDWLVARLQETSSAEAEPSKRLGHVMPDFGFTPRQAADVSAFVFSLGKPSEGTSEAGDARQGEILFRSVGCLACHSDADVGQSAAVFGGDLTRIPRKRSRTWLAAWLKDPKAIHAETRMPVVPLTEGERADIATYLATRGAPVETPKIPNGDAAAGRDLFVNAKCAACHATGIAELDAREPLLTGVPAITGPGTKLDQGCLSERPSPLVPRFPFSAKDRTDLQDLLKGGPAPLAKPTAFELGRRLLEQKNCLGCHDRDGQRGMSAIASTVADLDDALRGQSEGLIPPDLTAVGDKLTDEALAKSIAGEQPWVRLPWLKVRMPKFTHTPDERDALLAYLIDHDRLPERENGELPEAPPEDPKKKPGQQLLGSKGFNCSACHRIGQFEPRNVALGTRGSDLHGLGTRMRLPYFLRWTRAPLRIVPGMEMPSYEKPVKGILGEKLEVQLVAMWNSLNEKAPPAVDGSSVEQVVSVKPKERPVVLRDVFRLGEVEPHTWVARPIVIGLGNGQNALFDLDTASLRLWWAGDVARQRTLGKTWFWEPGTTVVVPAGPVLPDVALQDAKGTILLPDRDGTTSATLRSVYEDEGIACLFKYDLCFKIDGMKHVVRVREFYAPDERRERPPGFYRAIKTPDTPAGWTAVFLRAPHEQRFGSFGPVTDDQAWRAVKVTTTLRDANGAETSVTVPREALAFPADRRDGLDVDYGATPASSKFSGAPAEPFALKPEPVTVVPGYDGVRLPLDRKIMPTAVTWRPDGTLALCSLKGQVYLAKDSDADGIEDQLQLFEEGLAAPYGLIADGDALIVAHKPELLRLHERRGRADFREVVATGWGYSDNYHDWTCGIVRDSKGNFFVGLGSDYAQPERDRATTKWRGAVLRVDPQGKITPMGFGFRYPTGLAITPDDQVFVSDNQGVQNTFNEINHLVDGAHYGVPALADDPKAEPVLPPAIQVPHPWTRSVNGLFFLPRDGSHFAGHGIGCEYDTRFLIRFSLQKVGDVYQGATYAFSHTPPAEDETQGFLGTLVGGVSPKGDIYIGSIYDSGWLGGPNVGDLVRLRRAGELPLGIREARIWKQGFELDFTGAVDATAAVKPENYTISAYTRKWSGAYTTPDTGRHTVTVKAAKLAKDGRGVQLTVDTLQPGYVYEITPRNLANLFPDTAHYTVNRVP